MIRSMGAAIQLGDGDVDIFYGGTKNNASLVMRNRLNKCTTEEKNRLNKLSGILQTLPDDIIVSFHDPAGIDALISCLEQVKKYCFAPSNEAVSSKQAVQPLIE